MTRNNPIIQQYLKQTGLSEEEFFSMMQTDPTLQHDESTLADIKTMTSFLKKAFLGNKEITVYPDYDADGVCSGMLAFSTLSALGYNVNIIAPKSSDGYGFSYKIVKDLYPNTSYILTTDNGINKDHEVNEAFNDNVFTLVTDHHLGVIEEYPHRALSCVNPNRVDKKETYPFKELSGTGVVYKVLLHLAKEIQREDVVYDLENVGVVLVGISTISDVMTVKDENRYFIKKTIDIMNEINDVTSDIKTAYNEEFRYLQDAYSILSLRTSGGAKFDISNIGFGIAPLLNSPRRINETSEAAFEFFLNPSDETYETLHNINQERKKIVSDIVANIDYTYDDKNAIVYQDDNIPPGIAGLIAGRLANQYNKPTIVLSEDGGGSARSVKGYSIHNGLKYVEENLPKALDGWGGHHMAAGLKINPGYYSKVESLLSTYFDEHFIKDTTQTHKRVALHYDQTNKQDVFEAIDIFDKAEPFVKDDIPLYKFEIDLSQDDYTLMKGTHLKVFKGKGVNLIAWNTSPDEDFKGTALCSASINNFRGYKNLQFVVSEFITDED